MKNRFLIGILVALVIGAILVPIREGHQWLLAFNIVLYAILGYLLSKGSGSNFLANQQGDQLPANLQMYVWSVLILSTLSTALAHNFHDNLGCANPGNIDVPEALWILLGISGLAIAGEKATQKPDASEDFLRTTKTTTNALTKATTTVAVFDVEKLQFILFLVISASAFLLLSFDLFAENAGCVASLPELSNTLAILGGVSNGAYLAARVSG